MLPNVFYSSNAFYIVYPIRLLTIVLLLIHPVLDPWISYQPQTTSSHWGMSLATR